MLMIPAQADTVGGATTTTALNLRSGAGLGNQIITTMPKGATVVVKSSSDGWSKVVYNGTEGYASSDYLSIKTALTAVFGSGTITGDGVRLRSGPGTDSSVIGSYNKGTVMTVTGISGNWYAVDHNGRTGYVSADYLKLGIAAGGGGASKPEEEPTETPVSGEKGAVIGTSVRMRKGPGTSYDVLGYYSNGVTVTVLGSENGWYKVNYNGKTGYITAQYLRIVPETVYDTPKSGTVNASSLHLRMGPGGNYSSLGTYSKGKALKITGENAAWYEVAVNGVYGYMNKDYVKLDSGSGQEDPGVVEPVEEKTGIVTGEGVRMRSGPDTTYSVVGYYNRGTKMTITGKTGNWYAVNYKGLSGYISADYISLSSGDTQVEKIIETAKSYLGTPYVYGGAAPGGFDCSGFIYFLYTQYGYSIYRTASTQFANDGEYVEKADLKPGDLVFFGDSNDPIAHVGMYIGDGEFIHSSSGDGKVTITKLSMNYYTKYYAGAKRIIT